MALSDDLLALSRNVVSAGVASIPGLYVRSYTVGEMLAMMERKGSSTVHAALYGACDAMGVRVFGDDDEPKVLALAASVVLRIASAVQRHNGLHESADRVGDDEAATGEGGKAAGTQ